MVSPIMDFRLKLEIELKYFKDKTLIIATHNEKINEICNKFYHFELV